MRTAAGLASDGRRPLTRGEEDERGAAAWLVYSTFLGGFGDAVAVDSAGDAYVTGQDKNGAFGSTPLPYLHALQGVRRAPYTATVDHET